MKSLSPEMLAKVLTEKFPPDASCWSHATDEVRDMCRKARILAGVGDDGAVDFQVLTTPAQWNRHGIEGTVRFYEMLDEQKRQQFCSFFAEWLTA